MTTITSPKAESGSTYVLTCAFTDADGTEVTPTTVVWSLTDNNGNIINSRDDVSITPGTSINIVLSGDDLLRSDGTVRKLTIDAVYNSSTYGTDLPLTEQATFYINDFVSEVV